MSARAALNVVYRVALGWAGTSTDEFDDLLALDPLEAERQEANDMLKRLRAAGGAVA